MGFRPHGWFNVPKVIQYLGFVGVTVDSTQREEWLRAEKGKKAENQKHRAAKKYCGHFRTYQTRVSCMEGTSIETNCATCHKTVSERWL